MDGSSDPGRHPHRFAFRIETSRIDFQLKRDEQKKAAPVTLGRLF